MTRAAGDARRRQPRAIHRGSIPAGDRRILRSRTWYLTTTPRGRRSPALAWRVTTAAGDTWELSGLQRAALLWLTSSAGYGRHTATVTELGLAIGCSRGTASKVLRRLRSLSLIGAPRPHRGRIGGFRFWLPRAGSVRADAARRRIRWPTFGNDSTPTPFGGYLTREGMRRSWRASANDRSGGPPVAAAPRRVASPANPRARGRPWPPRYVDERCAQDRARVRLVRSADRGTPAGDLAATYTARCPRCHLAIAASAVLVRPDTGLVTVGTVAANLDDGRPAARRDVRYGSASRSPAPVVWPDSTAGSTTTSPDRRSVPANGRPSPRAAAAAAVIPELRHRGQVDRLRIDHLGYRRRELEVPPVRPAIAGDDLATVAAAAWAEAIADLEAVTASRELEPPA